MVKLKDEDLTPIGKVVHNTGLSLSYLIEKSGITRNRLRALRSVNSAILSFDEAQALAPALKMSLDELAKEIKKAKKEEVEKE